MNRVFNSLFLLGVLSIAGCKEQKSLNENEQKTMNDPHSYANTSEVITTHLSLDVEVDFNQQQISGVATWTIDNKSEAEQLILDIDDLHVDSIVLDNSDIKVDFKVGKRDHIMGSSLVVNILPTTQKVSIYYRTGKDAMALQWLMPEQTFGKRHPFVYTQSQSIYARSWIPCQDGPGVRFTYNATVRTPPELMALMSSTSNPQQIASDGVYHFEMSKPIPAYLMALAVGHIDFKPLDSRIGVYAEPEIINSAWQEFEETNQMMQIAEDLYGSYVWGRYDILVLPSGFPFGGMENPILTFSTPTIIAGDKSLVNLIAHELAHSWSGNLVTNETWNDFWLNEGFTVYFERRISEALLGKDNADMLWELGYQDLEATVANLGQNHPDTKLKLDLGGRDPNDGLTDIAYEKGAFLLLTIEETVGRERWDKFINEYFEKYAFKTINTDKFIDYLYVNLLNENPNWKQQIQVEKWVFEPGIPDNCPKPERKKFDGIEKAVEDFRKNIAITQLQVDNWSTHEWIYFLRQLPTDVSKERMADLDQRFKFTQSKNSEILCVWLQKAIKADYVKANSALKEFLLNTGRMKFLEPLYTTLIQTEKGRKQAADIYQIARPNYHPLAQKMVDNLLDR